MLNPKQNTLVGDKAEPKQPGDLLTTRTQMKRHWLLQAPAILTGLILLVGTKAPVSGGAWLRIPTLEFQLVNSKRGV